MKLTTLFFGANLSALCCLLADPVISDFSITEDQIVFQVTGIESDQQVQLQTSTDLLPGIWPLLTGAQVNDLGSGTFMITADRPTDPKLFFRAIAFNLGTATDLDGDGLPNEFETTVLGTNPNLNDSDNDGFFDGLEFSLGTDPNSNSDFPDLTTAPTVAFESGMSSATEGGGTHMVTINGTDSYTGAITYSVNARSTANTPEDYTISSSSVMMINGVAQIPVTLTDDLIISPERLLLIDLEKEPPGNFYRAAGAVTHVVCLTDNDSYWNGVHIDNASQRNFRMRLLRDANSLEWAFVTGNEDGLAMPEDGTILDISSQTTGLIPNFDFDESSRGTWIAPSSLFTDTRLEITSPEMPVTSGGYTVNTPLKRVLSLTADITPFFRLLDPPNLTPRATEPSEPMAITGTSVETISHATDPSVTYLDATMNGTFILTKAINEVEMPSSAYDTSNITN